MPTWTAPSRVGRAVSSSFNDRQAGTEQVNKETKEAMR
jgi:hypothetical protein